MAILSTFKEKAQKGLMKAADTGANIVAKASGLSSAQLRNIEEKRHRFLSEKPDTDPEGIKRLLGSYAIEAYEAYLPQISNIYEPIEFTTGNEGNSLLNRIRYFEITKWVSDSSEDSLEKLINVYQVVSRDNCNVALIYNRKKDGCKVYFAVISTDSEDKPQIVDALEERIISAMKGNFPGVEIKERSKKPKGVDLYGVGLLECLEKTEGFSVASVSNVATEKSEDFINQSMEKLLDGICPNSDDDEYTVVLLATPVMAQLDRKNELSELYSKLAPYANWQTSYTYNEAQAEGSSATFGVSLGASVGRQSAKAELHTASNEHEERDIDSEQAIRDEYEKNYKQTIKKISAGIENTISAGLEASISASVEASAYIPVGVKAKVKSEMTAKVKTEITTKVKAEIEKAKIKQNGVDMHKLENIGHEISDLSKSSDLHQTGKRGIDLGVNFGANFSRSSDVSVTIGKSEGITQTFTNYGIQYTLETIKKQISRLEESSALGMWDFSAYFLSKSPVIANNAAHMYLALTQGDESYLSQSAVNLWVPPANINVKDENKKVENEHRQKQVKSIIEFIKRLQHPEFQLREMDDDEWLMYPPHVSPTVSLTGRELARSLNFPKKSVSGLPVIEAVAYGRNVKKYSNDEDDKIEVGSIVHMRHKEPLNKVELSSKSLTSHTFITGSTGTGKTTAALQLINKARNVGAKFLVIEPTKGEYKKKIGGNCKVYGTNNNVTDQLLKINPFWFPENVHVLEHIDRLIEILNACWPMYAAMPAVLKDAVERAYINNGWNLVTSEPRKSFPTFYDLLETLPEVMEDSMYSKDTKSDYSGALITRVKSLTNGLNKAIFCDEAGLSEADLFENDVIVDISRIGGVETKSLIMGILIMKLQEYWISKDKFSDKLEHITVLEEAHNILKKTSTNQSQEGANLQGKSVEMITNAIAEMRAYGEGFIIADQAPNLLDEAAIRNTNTKIVLRLPEAEDRLVVGKSCSLTDKQIDEIGKLPNYTAVVYQNDWIEAVLCYFEDFTDINTYKKKEDMLNEKKFVNEQKYIQFIFDEKNKIELDDAELENALKWIESLQTSNNTKRLLRKAFVQGEIDRKALAYNMFQGKNVAKVLEENYDEEQAIKLATRKINALCNIHDEELLRNICCLIILQVCEFNNKEGEFAERFMNIAERRLLI